MKRCQKNLESLGQTSEQQQHQQQNQQQHQQQYQQQTTAEEQRCPFLPTTPAWGDRNVSEQPTEETNNNFSFSFAQFIPSTSDARIPTCNLSPSKNNSSSPILNLTENTMNQSSSDVQLPRKCRLCSYIAISRTEYIDHVITHSIFVKSSYVENDNLNGYVEDDELDDSGNELLHSKGKKRNKISKPKPCSKCDFVAKTKLSLWLHLRQHFIQEECTGFVCTSCPFATTLKHHMTFHWFSAHDDFKAYICTKCSYACVSKSMLTSHMKTHSEVYQYNCGSCSYRTKFCNAMKKHLKDSKHKAGLVLNPDGTPNPFATIDVYGSKRGPRRRPFNEVKQELTETIEDVPSTSRMSSPISLIPTSSNLVIPTPISSTAILPNVALMSPVRMPTQRSPVQSSPTQRSPVRMSTPVSSHSNTLVTTLNNLFNKMNNEDGVNPSINGSPQNDNLFNVLCYLLFKDITTCQNMDDKEQGQVLRLLQNAYRYLVINQEHVASTIDANGDLSDNARNIDEPSTSTISDESQSEDEILDQPLDLSMSTMSKRKKQAQASRIVRKTARMGHKTRTSDMAARQRSVLSHFHRPGYHQNTEMECATASAVFTRPGPF